MITQLLKLLKRCLTPHEKEVASVAPDDQVLRNYTWHLDSVRKRKLHGELTLRFSKQEMENH